MKVLYIIKRDIDATAQGMIEQHRKDADVSIIDIRENKDYAGIVEQVFGNDKVICW
jgi:hypothetical protein